MGVDRSLRRHECVPNLLNAWLRGAMALSVVSQFAVVHLGFLNVAFGTVPLSLEEWLLQWGVLVQRGAQVRGPCVD